MYSILSINERDTTPLISQGLSKAQQRLDLLIKADQDRNVLAILYYCRARVLALQGKAEAAFSDLTESITLNRKFESALFLRGTLRSQRGLMDLALSDFMILLHCNPKYPQLASSIGYCHYINGDYFKAFDFLSRALEDDPQDPWVYYARGCVGQEVFALEQARLDFKQTIALGGSFIPRAHLQMAYCSLILKEYSTAMTELQAAKDAGCHDKALLMCRGFVHLIQDQFHDAINDYSELIRGNKSSDVVMYRGLAYMNLDAFELAHKDFEDSRTLDCRNPISLLYLKACRLAENPTLDVTDTFLDCLPHLHQYIKGMKQKCGPSLRKILPGRVFHDRRADLRMCFRKTKTLQRRKGRSKSNLKARQLFRQVIRNVLFRYRLVQALEHSTPITRQRHLERIEMLQTMLNPQQISAPDGDFTARNVAWVHNVLGILYARNNNMEESLRHMDSAVSLDHREGLFHFNRGNVLHRTNQLETAIQEYTTALGVDPQFFKAQMNLATVNVLVGQVDAAFPMAQEAIVLMGNADAKCQASMYYNLANLFFLKQQPERAIKYFTDSIQLDALFETFTNRGAAYNQLGKLDLALQDYNKALELNPNCWESLVNRSRLHIGNSNCYLASKDIKLAHSIQPTALTEKLFHFCRRWQNSIRVAADDIARALKALPCFASFELDGSEPIVDPTFRTRGSSCSIGPPIVQKHLEFAFQHVEQNHLDLACRDLMNAVYRADRGSHAYYLCFISRAQLMHDQGDLDGAIGTLMHFLGYFDRGLDTNIELSYELTPLQRTTIESDAHTLLGNYFQLQHRDEEALKAYNKAIDLRSDHIFALVNLSALARKLSNIEASMTAQVRLISIIAEVNNGSGAKSRTGLMKSRRNVQDMIATEKLFDASMKDVTLDLNRIVTTYLSLISRIQLQQSSTHLYSIQGELAECLERLESGLVVEEQEKSNEAYGDHLNELNGLVDECIRQVQHVDDVNDPKLLSLMSKVQTQYATVCDSFNH